MTTLDQTIADNVRAAMKQEGLSQEDLAARTGISERTLNRRLAGESEWGTREIAKIARLFQVRASELLSPDFDYSHLSVLAAEVA